MKTRGEPRGVVHGSFFCEVFEETVCLFQLLCDPQDQPESYSGPGRGS